MRKKKVDEAIFDLMGFSKESNKKYGAKHTGMVVKAMKSGKFMISILNNFPAL